MKRIEALAYIQYEAIETIDGSYGWFATTDKSGGLWGVGETTEEAREDLLSAIADWNKVADDI